jgi:hypothetical protein
MRPPIPKCFLALLSLALLLSFVQNVSGLTVTGGPTVTAADTTATIVWTTDVEAGTRLQYGTQEKLLDQRATGGVGKEHRIELSGLRVGTRYYFSIGSARTLLGQGSFQTTGGSPASTPTNETSPVGGAIKRFLAGLLPEKAAEPAVSSSKTSPATPPTSQTWCRLDTLEDHFERHGADFKSTSSDHYAAQAWRFLQHARQSALPMKWDAADRTLRVWEPKTRTFAAYDSRGRTRTFFRPSNPDYWNRQPGRPVEPDALPFR